jgi:hypothetical protein
MRVSAAAVERKPRRVVLVELVIDFLALPKVEGFDGRAGRVLTHPSGSLYLQRGCFTSCRLKPFTSGRIAGTLAL